MDTPDLFSTAAGEAASDAPAGPDTAGVHDEYVSIRVDEASCPQALAEDLRGLVAADWLAKVIRHDFEEACYDAPIYGPCGTFEGVLSNTPMPNHWRAVEGSAPGGVQLWVPDGRHPFGKWLADMAARLLPLPSLDILDAVLRRNGIEGGKDYLPSMHPVEGGFALFVYKPKDKAFKIPGVRADESLRALWQPRKG